MTKIEEIGNAWTHPKTGEVRYYVNDWQDMVELEVCYYKTGNVSAVYFKDEERSNSWFKKHVAGTKVWVSENKEVHVDYCDDGEVENAIKDALNAMLDDSEEVVDICSEGSVELGGVACMEIPNEASLEAPADFSQVKCDCGRFHDFTAVSGGSIGVGMRKGLNLDLCWSNECDCGRWIDIGAVGKADTIHYGDASTEWSVGCDSDSDVFLGCPYCGEEFNVFLNIADGREKGGRIDSDRIRLDWDISCPYCAETIETGLSAPISETYAEAFGDGSEGEADLLDEWTGTVKITAHGNSLDIKVTDAARALGLDRGDYVEVTIRRK